MGDFSSINLLIRPLDISSFIPPIYAIKSKGEKEILSNGSEIIKEGDTLVFVTNSTSKFRLITRAIGEFDSELPDNPTVAIFGATHFGSKIAKRYLSSGSSVVIAFPSEHYDSMLLEP